MLRFTPLTLIVTLLALAGPAAAKNVMAAQVCGADGCRTIDHPTEALLMGGPGITGPSRPAPFVRFRYTLGAPGGPVESARNLFVPSLGLILADDGQTWIRPAALALMRSLARHVTPFPATRFPVGSLTQPPVATSIRQPVPATHDGGGSSWWIALVAGPLAIALGALLVRRRRQMGPAATA
jgi:hypothetical protein